MDVLLSEKRFSDMQQPIIGSISAVTGYLRLTRAVGQRTDRGSDCISVDAYAWAEVEHDLIYKPLAGPLSGEEYAILDELNGLVLAGEIMLERLQEAGQSRVRSSGSHFKNHYELASYLAREAADPAHEEPIGSKEMGRVDVLSALLRRLAIDNSDDLVAHLHVLHDDYERRPLAEQVIDALIENDDAKYEMYRQVRARIDDTDDTDGEARQEMRHFLQAWRDLEGLIRDIGAPYVKQERTGPPYQLLTETAV
jgi:hypothetical protein